MFQEDIYPDTLSGEPSLSANEWFAGKDAGPKLVSMESIYRSGNAQTIHQRGFVPQASHEPAARSEQSEVSAPKAASAAPDEPPSSTSPTSTKAPAFSGSKMPASSEKQYTKDERPQKQAQIPESAVPPATSVNVKLPQVRVPFLTKLILADGGLEQLISFFQ